MGDHVLIAADQGQALAQVVSGPYDYVAGVEPESLTPIERRATEEDLAEGRTNEKLAREATEFCRQCIRDRRLDMKLVDVEVFLTAASSFSILRRRPASTFASWSRIWCANTAPASNCAR